MFERQNLKTFLPIRMYPEEIKKCNIPFEDINVGDYVFAEKKICTPQHVFLHVGGIDAIIDIDEFDVYDSQKNWKYAHYNVAGGVLAKVLAKKHGGLLLLSRKKVIEESIEHIRFQTKEAIDATIESFAMEDGSDMPYGAFVDIGNGVSTLLHISEFSAMRIRNLKEQFSLGELVKVKIKEYHEKNNTFWVSRKLAYPLIGFNRKTEIVVKGGGTLPTKDGVLAEYNPRTTGIVDIPKDLKNFDFYGTEMRVRIRKQREIGFHADFIDFV